MKGDHQGYMAKKLANYSRDWKQPQRAITKKGFVDIVWVLHNWDIGEIDMPLD